jgi:hypothetical protein
MQLKDQITFPNLGNKGRLGNQLFQIAATISTAIDNDLSYAFPDWKYNQFLKKPIPTCNDLKPTHFYTEPLFRYNKINLPVCTPDSNMPPEIYALEGYFQSRKYFEKHEDIIRKQFTPSQEIENKLYRKYYPSLSPQLCAIHVRRGDYVDLAYYHQIKMDYYEKSMLEINQKTGIKHFMIFSDDIAWCKENFTNPEYQYTFMEDNTDWEDLILMSCCRHQIIANSSFSWWGAFLNRNPDKIVIFPEKWFGEVANLDATDLYY